MAGGPWSRARWRRSARLGFCRLAEPGEFTRRAFEHGKLDLTQAEAIADLVAAETDQQRKLALQQMDGALHRLYEDWRTLGLRTLAHLEAAIDFPDEDLPTGIADQVRAGITQLQAEIAAHLDDRRGERLRGGLSIAIIGPPNAGKSSLLNLLARREAAIVSEIAGTTRDVIEVHIDLGGWPVVLADTAGLRLSGDAIEQEGVRRAKARAASADLRVLVLDAVGKWKSEMQALTETIERWNPALDIVVVNKVDLAPVKAPGVVSDLGDVGDGPARAAEAAGAVGRDADAERRRRRRRSPARAIARRSSSVRSRWAGRSSRRRLRWRLKTFGWRCGRSAASPARCASMNCWTSSSATSASGSNPGRQRTMS